jgi:hypothetical protein
MVWLTRWGVWQREALLHRHKACERALRLLPLSLSSSLSSLSAPSSLDTAAKLLDLLDLLSLSPSSRNAFLSAEGEAALTSSISLSPSPLLVKFSSILFHLVRTGERDPGSDVIIARIHSCVLTHVLAVLSQSSIVNHEVNESLHILLKVQLDLLGSRGGGVFTPSQVLSSLGTLLLLMDRVTLSNSEKKQVTMDVLRILLFFAQRGECQRVICECSFSMDPLLAINAMDWLAFLDKTSGGAMEDVVLLTAQIFQSLFHSEDTSLPHLILTRLGFGFLHNLSSSSSPEVHAIIEDLVDVIGKTLQVTQPDPPEDEEVVTFLVDDQFHVMVQKESKRE